MILSDQRHTAEKSYAQAVTAENRTWRGTSNNIVSKKIHDGTAKERGHYNLENNQYAGTVFLAILEMSASTQSLCSAIAVVIMDTRDDIVTRQTR